MFLQLERIRFWRTTASAHLAEVKGPSQEKLKTQTIVIRNIDQAPRRSVSQ